jgi:hypothetical protein
MQRLRKYVEFGGEPVMLSDEDLATLKKQANAYREEPGLTVIGFKDKAAIPWYHTLETPYLIYPNDDVVQGSREAFVNLHAAMLRKSVIAIGEVLHRVTFKSRLCAMYPIEETFEERDNKEDIDEHGDSDERQRQRSPPGMVVKYLPFEEDMRALEPDAAMKEIIGRHLPVVQDYRTKEESDQVESCMINEQIGDAHASGSIASEEAVTAAMELVRRQHFEGMELGLDFENGALARFFNYLEAVALGATPNTEHGFDTVVDDKAILQVAVEQIQAFQQALPEDLEVESKPKTTSRKRKLVPDESGLDWVQLYQSNAVDTCTVDQLKKFLRSVGDKISGNKMEISFRVSKHLEKEMSSNAAQVAVKLESEERV